MTPIRVIHLTPSLAGGGAERILIELLNQLPPSQVTQGLAWLYPVQSTGLFYLPQLQTPHPPMYYLDKYAGKLARIPTTWRYWRMIREFRPQIIHAHQWHPTEVARAYKRLFPNIKVVCSLQNSLLPENVVSERQWWSSADAMIAVGQEVADQYLEAIPQSADRLSVIPNAVNTDQFVPADRRAARQRVLPELAESAVVGVLVGRITPQKNHIGLLQAVHHLVSTGRWPAQAIILLVGQTDDPAYEQEVLAYWHEHQLSDYVRFCALTQHVKDYYDACDVVLLPSHYEGLSRVALEAQASARPVLISQDGNNSQLIQDNKTGWVIPSQDPTVIAEWLERVFKLPTASRDALGEAGRLRVVQGFSLQKMLDAHVELYQSLVKG